MTENAVQVDVPKALGGLRVESARVGASLDFSTPEISLEPGDRGMESGSRLDGCSWRRREVREESLPGLGGGTVTADEFELDGIVIRREVFLAEGSTRMAVRGIVENRTGIPLSSRWAGPTAITSTWMRPASSSAWGRLRPSSTIR